jgi:hypothetical protein
VSDYERRRALWNQQREAWRTRVQPAKLGKWTVEQFKVEDGGGVEGWRQALYGRPVPDGTYTRLIRGAHQLVMSDTPTEMRDHGGFMHECAVVAPGGRVLINGLGLGCALNTALVVPNVEHVDVVEIDPELIKLVGPYFADEPRVTVHQGDAFTFRFPPGTRWDVAWHDVWDDICGDNLASMARLARRYGGRVGWQGCWAKEQCKRFA